MVFLPQQAFCQGFHENMQAKCLTQRLAGRNAFAALNSTFFFKETSTAIPGSVSVPLGVGKGRAFWVVGCSMPSTHP